MNEPQLTGVQIWFHSKDDGKNDGTPLVVIVREGKGTLVAVLDQKLHYSKSGAPWLPCPDDVTRRLANTPTLFQRMDGTLQCRIVRCPATQPNVGTS